MEGQGFLYEGSLIKEMGLEQLEFVEKRGGGWEK